MVSNLFLITENRPYCVTFNQPIHKSLRTFMNKFSSLCSSYFSGSTKGLLSSLILPQVIQKEMVTSDVNSLKPNDPYRGRTAPLTTKFAFYIFIQKIQVLNILNKLYTLRFFSSKCSLFHNTNVFDSCIIHILYTGCAKIGLINCRTQLSGGYIYVVYYIGINYMFRLLWPSSG